MEAARKIMASIAALCSFCSNAYAGGFLEDVGRVAVAPITVPADVTKRIIQRDNPTEAINGPMQSAGRVVSQSSDQFQRAHTVVMNVPRSAIQNNFGGDWVRAYDYLTGSQRVQFELATTAGRFLGQCIQGSPCGLNQLVALPLAAAMRDAYKIYLPGSVPLDPNVIRILSLVVPLHILQQARWTVGNTPDFTIPGFLNAGHEAAGEGHAVTLANVMIFSRVPNLAYTSEWEWLIHELRHIEQYLSYSSNYLEAIDGFAVQYVQYSGGMEQDARNAAAQRRATLDHLCQNGC